MVALGMARDYFRMAHATTIDLPLPVWLLYTIYIIIMLRQVLKTRTRPPKVLL